MRRALIALCCVGSLASTAAFAALSLAPQASERHVRSAVLTLLKRELSQQFKVELADNEVVSGVQQSVARRIGGLHAQLADPMTDFVAALFAHLCHYACGTRAQVADMMRDTMRDEIEQLHGARARILGWASSRYASVVRELVLELRIFTGSNAVLLVLALIGLTRAPGNRSVQACAMLIMAATLVSGYFYIANQNWLLTFVLSDYVGWAYLAWVGVVLVFLVDIIYLRGHITNAVTSVFGTAAG